MGKGRVINGLDEIGAREIEIDVDINNILLIEIPDQRNILHRRKSRNARSLCIYCSKPTMPEKNPINLVK